MTETPREAPRYKVHSSFIWLGGLQTAFSLLVLFVVIFFSSIFAELGSAMQNNPMGIMLIVVAILVLFIVLAGLVLLIRYFSYKHLWFEMDEDEFSLYSGILSKKRVHVPYMRIQSVNQRASLIQRIAGVCTVHIDTAGGAQNKAVVVPYLRKSDAEWLRTQLFYQKQVLLQGHAAASAAKAAMTPGASLPAPAGQPVVSAAAMPPPPAPAAPVGAPVIPGSMPAMAPGMTPGAIPGAIPGAPPGAYPGAPGYPAYPVTGATGAGNVLDTPAGIMSDMRGVFGGAGFDLGAESYSYGLSNKELVLTGMSNSTGFAVIILTVIGGLIGVGFMLMETYIGQQIGREGAEIISSLVGQFILPTIIGGFIIVILITWLLSVGGTCLNYGGFTARRRGSRVEVEHGILQHRFDGVDIDRVQSVIIKQSFIRRLIGYCEISLGKINALTDSQQQQNNAQTALQRGLVVHPFVKVDRVPEILAGLVPEFADVPAPADAIKLPKVSLRRALLRRTIILGNGFWTAVIIAVIHICLILFLPPADLADASIYINAIAVVLYILCAVILILDAIAAVLWFRRSNFAYNQHFMQISNGGFSFESVSIPRKKIQFGFVRSNPFQRMSKVITINVRTAAGVGGTNLRLLDTHEADAELWFDWLHPHRHRSAWPPPVGEAG